MTNHALSYQPLACENQFLLVLFMCDLTMVVVSFIVGELIVCHCVLACQSCMSLALQDVSGCHALLQFLPVHHACLWLFSM